MKSKNPWKTIKRNLIFQSNFGHRVFSDDVLTPSGKPSKYIVVEVKDCVVILAMNKDGDVIMEKQWRYPINEESLELPAGGVDDKESPLQAAKRELKEETGGVSKKWVNLGWHYTDNGFLNVKTHVFLALGAELGESQQEENEKIIVKKISWKKLFRMVMAGNISDSRTKMAVLLTNENLKNKSDLRGE